MQLDTVVCGDCLDILPTIPDQSVDAVFTDPPYPHIKRDYGYWTTEEWWQLIVESVVPEVRRILKPTGSAVFILQPNSEKVGKMRGWLFEFQAWVCREWNLVRDMYWWNYAALPSGEGIRRGLPKLTVKVCIWAGQRDCFRDRSKVMWEPSQATLAHNAEDRALKYSSSGLSTRASNIAVSIQKNRGAIPCNLLPFANSNSQTSAGAYGHGAGTPLKLTDWWLRYIVPPGGIVIDPFMGSGTTAVAAIKQRKHFFGCDTVAEYVDIANERIKKARAEMRQMEMELS